MTAPVDDGFLLERFDTEARLLGDVAPERFDTDVPTCPGWTVGALVGHVGRVQHWGAALSADPEATLRWRDVQPPAVDELPGWYARGVELVNATFDGADLDVAVRTWAGTRPRRWWLRRLAHETALHRWDAEHASGSPHPLDARLAVDGIDEVLEVFVPDRFAVDAFGGRGETWHLHATDVAGEWLVRFAPERVEITREHAKGDCATRGPAAALYLLLWGRIGPGGEPLDGAGVEAFGDLSLIERWQAATRF